MAKLAASPTVEPVPHSTSRGFIMETKSRSSRGAARFGLVAVALLTLGNTGCVVFEKQTMVVSFPKGSKEARVLMVYEGVRVGGTEPKDLENARKQLTALTQNKYFYGGHYMFPVELERRPPP